MVVVGIYGLVVVVALLLLTFFVGRADGRSMQDEARELISDGRTHVSAVLTSLHGLVQMGVLEERHVVEYVEALISSEKASALSMLTHARVAAKDGMVSHEALTGSDASAAPAMVVAPSTGA